MFETLGRAGAGDKWIGSQGETVDRRANGHTSAIEKALAIQMLVLASGRPLGTVEISRLTGFHKATTSRILSTLANAGLIAQHDLTRKYGPGPQFCRLNMAPFSRDLQAVAAASDPALNALHTQTGHPVGLFLWTGSAAVRCHHVPASRFRAADDPDEILPPLHVAAGAKAILAYLAPDRVDRLLPAILARYTDRTIICRAHFLTALATIRDRGHALEIEERRAGEEAVAVPVRDRDGHPLGAVSLNLAEVAPAAEIERLVVAMQQAAGRLAPCIERLAPSGFLSWHFGHA